jgi:hypothetical protein
VAEPVDPADDWAVTRGAKRAVSYAAFDPAADAHATSVGCVGVRGPARVTEEAGRVVTRRTWTLTGLAARPVLRSLVLDGPEAWVVEAVTPDPAGGTVFLTDCVLNG